MNNKIKKTQIVLFASLMAVMILPFSMVDSFAETRDDKIERLGNQGMILKEAIDNEVDSTEKINLEDDMEELNFQMRILGIPTVEEYEANKEYWRNIAVQQHLNELDKIAEDEISLASYSEVDCKNCNEDKNKVAKFQTAYGYDCYAGLWTCHAYAPAWAYASDGETAQQTLTIGNDHNWIDPFWLIGGNQRMSVTYQYHHVNYDDGHRQKGQMVFGGDTQFINNAHDIDSVSKSDRVPNPRSNYSVDTQWSISSMR